MTPKQTQRIQKHYSMGKSRYVWVYGAGVYGIVTGLLVNGLQAIFVENWGMQSFVINMIVIPIAGLIYGHYMWEKVIRKHAESES